MAIEAPEEDLNPCPQCGLRVVERTLETCVICKARYCEYCAKHDFGRTFCSARCRGFFFWEDGDQDEKEN